MGKQNKNPGKRWQELLGLSAVPYFGQNTITYKDENQEEFIFDPETMSLINPIDIESGLYNKNAFEAGLYTPIYDDEEVFLGYAYQNENFTYLNTFLTDQNYNIFEGTVNINEEKQQVTSNAVSYFISDEFTDLTNYTLSFTYEVNSGNLYRNMILYGFDNKGENGYKIGIDIPRVTGLCVETIQDGEMINRQKYAEEGFSDGTYDIKIARAGSDAYIYIDDELFATLDNVENNTLGLWKWQNGFSSIKDIFLNDEAEVPETPIEPEKINISVTVTDGENPINSANVSLTNSNNINITGTTGTAGGCTLSNVPLGSYTLTASASDYTTYSRVMLITNETTTITITMDPVGSVDDDVQE